MQWIKKCFPVSYNLNYYASASMIMNRYVFFVPGKDLLPFQSDSRGGQSGHIGKQCVT
jgi:hypothetical protein